MCNRAVDILPCVLECIPDRLKTVNMCRQAVGRSPLCLEHVPNYFKTQRMCERAVENELYTLEFVSDKHKTKRMCERAVEKKSWLLKYVPDWFVTQQQIKLWHDDAYYYNDNYLIWYNDYQKRKAQKAKIKEELLPIAWNPDRVMDWCMSEDKKRPWK